VSLSDGASVVHGIVVNGASVLIRVGVVHRVDVVRSVGVIQSGQRR
jgi:hypothetical protein